VHGRQSRSTCLFRVEKSQKDVLIHFQVKNKSRGCRAFFRLRPPQSARAGYLIHHIPIIAASPGATTLNVSTSPLPSSC